MTDDRSNSLVPQGPTSLAPVSRLAERTLADRNEREGQALVATRTLLVGPGGYATISAAVDAARDGDTVLVRPGRYEESVVVEGKTITIRGDGERDAIVVGWDKGPAFRLVDTQSTLSGLTVLGGDPHVPEPDMQGALLVTGGAPRLSWLRVTRGHGIVFRGSAAGAIEHSQIDSNVYGIVVWEGASPRIEENEILENVREGLLIQGAGTDPLVRANRVYGSGTIGFRELDGASPRTEENRIWGNYLARITMHHGSTAGIWVWNGASPRIEENRIWLHHLAGIVIQDAGTEPLVGTNHVFAGMGYGILVFGGASPRIEENWISSNVGAGISITEAGTDPLVRANRISDGKDGGIRVGDGASPRIEENEIWANTEAGIDVKNASPIIIGNTVRDGLGCGMLVSAGASPTISGNTITGNALKAIRVDGDADPKIGQNVVRD